MKALCMSEKAMLYDQIVSLVEGGEGELLLGSSDDGAEHFESQKSGREIALSVVAYSHAWRSLNNIHADHVITSMPITQ